MHLLLCAAGTVGDVHPLLAVAVAMRSRGHRVTLFAHPDSTVAATLVPYGVPPHEGRVIRARELWQLHAAHQCCA